MLVKTDLFTARQGGYHNYRIPNILATDEGVVLATVEARRGSGGDWDDSDLLLRRSEDGGVTWESPVVLVNGAAHGQGPANNCVLLWERTTRTVHALYGHDYARVFHRISRDGGKTFGSPLEITDMFVPYREQYAWRVVAMGPGHGIQLRSGRLVASLWLSTGEGSEFGGGKLGHRPSVVAGIYSDDQGMSWQRGDIVAWHSADLPNPGETTVCELSDGRVLFNIRSEADHHRRLVATSPNGATDWSAPTPDDALLEPICMAAVAAYPLQPGTVLFSNPDNLEAELVANRNRPMRDRKRLTIKLSRDNAATWPSARVLEHGPAGYSDLAVLPNGEVLCIYEQGMVDRMTDPAAVTVARFDMAWLTGD